MPTHASPICGRLLLCTCLFAAPLRSEAVDLPGALALAARHSPALAAARLDTESYDGALQQAAARPNPTLSFDAQRGRLDERETTWLLTQPLQAPAKRDGRIAVARAEQSAAAATQGLRDAEVHAQAVAAFRALLLAQERVRLADDGVMLATRARDAVARKVAAGKLSPVEELRAGVAVAQARLERSQLGNTLAQAQVQLAALCGEAVTADGNADVLPEPPAGATLDLLVMTSPAVHLAQRERDQRDAQVQLARAERLPDVAVTLGSKRFGETGHRATIAGLSVPLPLFDRNQGATLQATRRAQQASLAMEAAQLEVRIAAGQAAADLASASAAAATLRHEVMPAAQEAYEAAGKGFEYGKFGVTDVLDAQRTLLRARADYLDALASGHRAAAELERQLGHHWEHAR
ncbi:cobalt-zinc-cadmium efflux system outer membrane protein [Pseudoduganella lurida]|uniref:Cobalt-zinc-cadmium efflux system outer membrane protein n=1 Tax=Pseudoduganella lurida TaxID=1036180 RepID=A0A562RBH4_9BURK|nr:TolC family protein [Pseudoduganella lurida]TWI66422.1 cobalt-zinc-cadmium efflux system outer membrane protein [Pseudoduganella lurida]